KRRHIDAVLALVVGGAPAVDPIAGYGRMPRIEMIAPLPDHAVDDIAVSVHQNGRSRSALAVFREKVWILPGRRFDQPRRKAELRKRRREVLGEIGAQRVALF